MKCKFLFNGTRYIAQSKKEARAFLKRWDGCISAHISRFETTWRLQGVERAPSYGQLERVNFDNIEYK